MAIACVIGRFAENFSRFDEKKFLSAVESCR